MFLIHLFMLTFTQHTALWGRLALDYAWGCHWQWKPRSPRLPRGTTASWYKCDPVAGTGVWGWRLQVGFIRGLRGITGKAETYWRALDEGVGRGSWQELRCWGWWREPGEAEDQKMARRPRERWPGWTTRHSVNHAGTFCFIYEATVVRGLQARRRTGSDLEQALTTMLATWKAHSHMSTVLFLKKKIGFD